MACATQARKHKEEAGTAAQDPGPNLVFCHTLLPPLPWLSHLAAVLHLMCHATMQLLLLLLLPLHMLQLQLLLLLLLLLSLCGKRQVLQTMRAIERQGSWKNYSYAEKENVCCQEKCALKLQPKGDRWQREMKCVPLHKYRAKVPQHRGGGRGILAVWGRIAAATHDEHAHKGGHREDSNDGTFYEKSRVFHCVGAEKYLWIESLMVADTEVCNSNHFRRLLY